MPVDATILRPYEPSLAERLVRHLGFDAPPGPRSPEALRTLHRAFLARVPYENLDIQLGRPGGIDPVRSAERILDGRGGYCYHLNGTLATLLVSLGYTVTVIAAKPIHDGVNGDEGEDAWGQHAMLLVDFADQTMIADVGLGDGPLDPIPLVPGDSAQPPFRYRVEHRGGLAWRLHHDPLGTLAGVDLNVRPLPIAAFTEQHKLQSSGPDSSFVRTLTVQARRADHTLVLRGRMLTRTDADGRHATEVSGEAEWWNLLTDEFGMSLDDLDATDRTVLWRRVEAGHEAWLRDTSAGASRH